MDHKGVYKISLIYGQVYTKGKEKDQLSCHAN